MNHCWKPPCPNHHQHRMAVRVNHNMGMVDLVIHHRVRLSKTLANTMPPLLALLNRTTHLRLGPPHSTSLAERIPSIHQQILALEHPWATNLLPRLTPIITGPNPPMTTRKNLAPPTTPAPQTLALNHTPRRYKHNHKTIQILNIRLQCTHRLTTRTSGTMGHNSLSVKAHHPNSSHLNRPARLKANIHTLYLPPGRQRGATKRTRHRGHSSRGMPPGRGAIQTTFTASDVPKKETELAERHRRWIVGSAREAYARWRVHVFSLAAS